MVLFNIKFYHLHRNLWFHRQNDCICRIVVIENLAKEKLRVKIHYMMSLIVSVQRIVHNAFIIVSMEFLAYFSDRNVAKFHFQPGDNTCVNITLTRSRLLMWYQH